MYNRREFLQKSLFGTAGLTLFSGLPQSLFSSEESEGLLKNELIKLTILHTNDMHSRIDPFPSNDPKFAGLGGMAKRATLIKNIRASEKNVLLLDAGDIFQGTPYFNLFGGELEFKLMSRMKYDACTLGNHDFDNGLEGLDKMLPHAEFPFICSNYDFSDTLLKGKTIPHKIFEMDGIKIGVFGIGIELNGLVEKKLYGNTIYQDPVHVAGKMGSFLKKEKKCNLVICLSHLGYQYDSDKLSDLILAKKTENIDIIIGGHTHTFLDEPAVVKNLMDTNVLVNQAGWGGMILGKIDCYFSRNNLKEITTKTNSFEVR